MFAATLAFQFVWLILGTTWVLESDLARSPCGSGFTLNYCWWLLGLGWLFVVGVIVASMGPCAPQARQLIKAVRDYVNWDGNSEEVAPILGYDE